VDNLDFSELTDDQVIGLIRAALQEAVRRHPALEAAAKAAVIEEGEKAKIIQAEIEKQASILRAKERERIAKEAAARVHAAHEAQNGEAQRRQEEVTREAEAAARIAKAKADVEKTQRLEAIRRGYLSRAAALVDLSPHQVTLVVYRTSVYINKGSDQYSRDHLAEYRGSTLSTRRDLISRKPAILELLAELRATYDDFAIVGSEYFEPEEVTT
jgi:hypothetical protein